MTKLEDLLYSLATLIIRYHDSQTNVKLVSETDLVLHRKKSRELAIQYLNDKKGNYEALFTKLIKESTTLYSSRSPFLHYILHEVGFFKKQLERTKTFEPLELKDYKKQIVQLFVDCKKLLTTVKGKTCWVEYSRFSTDKSLGDGKITLSGLINNAHIGTELCKSGILLKEELLEQFNILLSDPEKELHAVAESICQEHQNHLLVLELTAKNNALLNICTEQELQLARLELKVTKSDKECISYKQTILDLNNQVTEQRNSWRQNNHPATTGANPARNKNQLSDSQKIRLMIEPTSLLDGLYSKHAFFIPHGTAIDTNYLEEEIKNNTFD